MNKTYIIRVCPACGEEYRFWLFGRDPCKCTRGRPLKVWDNTPKEVKGQTNETLSIPKGD